MNQRWIHGSAPMIGDCVALVALVATLVIATAFLDPGVGDAPSSWGASAINLGALTFWVALAASVTCWVIVMTSGGVPGDPPVGRVACAGLAVAAGCLAAIYYPPRVFHRLRIQEIQVELERLHAAIHDFDSDRPSAFLANMKSMIGMLVGVAVQLGVWLLVASLAGVDSRSIDSRVIGPLLVASVAVSFLTWLALIAAEVEQVCGHVKWARFLRVGQFPLFLLVWIGVAADQYLRTQNEWLLGYVSFGAPLVATISWHLLRRVTEGSRIHLALLRREDLLLAEMQRRRAQSAAASRRGPRPVLGGGSVRGRFPSRTHRTNQQRRRARHATIGGPARAGAPGLSGCRGTDLNAVSPIRRVWLPPWGRSLFAHVWRSLGLGGPSTVHAGAHHRSARRGDGTTPAAT